MHNLTTLLSGQYDQCILSHRQEIWIHVHRDLNTCIVLYLCTEFFVARISDTIQKDHDHCVLWNHAKWDIIFIKKMDKGVWCASFCLIRHVSNHQRTYKKFSTKTRNVANALKHLYQKYFQCETMAKR